MINYTEKGHGLHEAIANAGHKLWNEDRAWKSTDDVAVQAIIDSYDPLNYEQLNAKIRIIEQIDAHTESLKKSYPFIEKEIFAYQKIEAEAHTLDSNAPTPTIDSIAASRGSSREDQLAVVKSKVIGNLIFAQALAGERQRLFDIIDASFDWEAVRNTIFDAAAM